ERDRDHEDDLVERAVTGEADDEQPAEEHDAVDRVRAAHERRVQRVGHLRDDDEADEAREHEDREVGRERAREDHAAASTLARAPWCTISPARTMHAPATISSSKSSDSVPSSPTRRSSSARTFRAKSCEACSGMLAGRLSGDAIWTS